MRTYVGQLREISYWNADGSTTTVRVQPVALSVDEGGLCTSPSKRDAKARCDYAAPKGSRWYRLAEVVYYRSRPGGDLWFHEIDGGLVAVFDQGGSWLPLVVLDVQSAQRCEMDGDYICGG